MYVRWIRWMNCLKLAKNCNRNVRRLWNCAVHVNWTSRHADSPERWSSNVSIRPSSVWISEKQNEMWLVETNQTSRTTISTSNVCPVRSRCKMKALKNQQLNCSPRSSCWPEAKSIRNAVWLASSVCLVRWTITSVLYRKASGRASYSRRHSTIAVLIWKEN